MINNIDNNETIVYNTQDIQRILKCGRKQAYELMCSSCFPSFRINTKHLIAKVKFDQWLEKNTGKIVVI